jgi:TRAP-type mannitol/chloroaromatic compound transport system permease small subunit
MSSLERFVTKIERLSELVGKGGSWLCAVMILAIGYEVIMRYIFRAPTLWSFDVSYMLGGSMYVLGLAWVLREDGNVRVDALSARFSPKLQLYINILENLGKSLLHRLVSGHLPFTDAGMFCHPSLAPPGICDLLPEPSEA